MQAAQWKVESGRSLYDHRDERTVEKKRTAKKRQRKLVVLLSTTARKPRLGECVFARPQYIRLRIPPPRPTELFRMYLLIFLYNYIPPNFFSSNPDTPEYVSSNQYIMYIMM